MKMKRFNPAAKNKPLSPKRNKPTGPVGAPDRQTKKGPTARAPRGNVDIFYQPDKSFTPDSTKKLPKKASKPKTRIGRSAASKKMAQKKSTNNPVK